MNVTTIGFPFGTAPGAPAFGTPDQAFALALGAATGLGTPQLPGAPAANDAGTPPAFANDAAPADPGKAGNPQARTQLGASITLAQLLTTGSKVAATVTAVQPAQLGAEAGAQVPADVPVAASAPKLPGDVPAEIAAEPALPVPAEAPPAPAAAQVAEAIVPPVSKDTAAPTDPATVVQDDANAPVPCPTSGQPAELDLPTATLPKPGGIVATPTVATPVKVRKPVTTDSDVPVPPADPLAAQPAATPVAVVAGSAPSPAPAAAAPDRKPDTARGGKTAPAAAGPTVAPGATASTPASADVMTPANSGKEPVASPNAGPHPDAALPAEAAKADARSGSAPLPQSFAAHVAQNTAPAQAHAAAAAPAAEPTVPARPGQLGNALGVEIARKVEAGEDTLRVRLNPAELGRVEVTLAFDDSGNLRATMRAESRHALELLRQDAPDLGRALDSAGVRSDAQSFRFESRSDGNGGSGGQSGQNQQRGNGQHAFNDEPETPAQAYRAIRNDGQVDLLA